MGAPKGNQFWKLRSFHGRKPIFEKPEQLWNAAVEYFDWVEANPLMSSKVVSCNGFPTVVEVPKMRAMTVEGLCLFLDISQSQLLLWKKEREDFTQVIIRIMDVIREQKFTGASADLLNANIIARDLGLKDAVKTELTGSDGDAVKIDTNWTVNVVSS